MKISVIDKFGQIKFFTGVLLSIAVATAVAGPKEDTELAEKEFARGDLMASMQLWRKAALEGYAPAQARLGDILDKSEEDVEAAQWYRRSADQGHAAGEFGLGQMYLKGEGVEKDPEKALVYIRLAADKSELPAVVMMMNAYRLGAMGLTPNEELADQWESKVAELTPGYVPTKAKKAGSN